MAEHLTEINTDSFQKEVLSSDIPVVVDFWADWCMPCKLIAPVVDELAKEYKGKIKFTKINVDNNTQLATDLQILSIPVLVVFNNGKEVRRIMGANPKKAIQEEKYFRKFKSNYYRMRYLLNIEFFHTLSRIGKLRTN